MLGRLARYMRIMGYDTMYPNLEITDTELIEICQSEERFLLSRDRQICRRYKRSMYMESDRIEEQIMQVVSLEKPQRSRLFTRCTRCNGILEKGSLNCREEFDPRKLDTVYHCPICGRCYWDGTHSDNILSKLNSLGVYNEDQGK